MKNKMKGASAMIVLIITMMINNLNAQTAGGDKQYIEIKTSAICGSCKATIEKAVNSVDGVKSVSLDLDTKIVKVGYASNKISAEEIKNAIVKAGYDADELPAQPEAYDHLDACCKKE